MPAVDFLRLDAPANQFGAAGPRLGAAEIIGVALIIAIAAGIRILHLDTLPFWVDEAESSINALTILEHGYPTDTYLNIPIYENTHVWFWPENPEYEFRDVSYSHRHFAVYHGWLPLYAIAASFALNGVKPDISDGPVLTKHDLSEQKLRTRAARLPAVAFAVIFLLSVFWGGRVFFGRDAGWAALIVGAIHPYHLQISDQARYYSAQVALTTACCVLLWLIVKDSRWVHVLAGAAAYVLLFHTHLLSFVTASGMLALSAPVFLWRHKDAVRKSAVFGVLVATGTLPWIWLTGFYAHQSRIPRAWSLLQMPSDLLRYPPFNWRYAAIGLPLLVAVAAVRRYGRSVLQQENDSITRLAPASLFLAGWAAVGYALFLLFIPAVSFTLSRLNLSYWGPLFLLFAVVSTAAVRILAPGPLRRFSPLLAPIVMAGFFLAAQHQGGKPSENPYDQATGWPGLRILHRPGMGRWDLYADVFRQLDSMHLPAGTKLYAAPNAHLVLTVYSGLPVQDITPVRKSFLDARRGEIVYIDLAIAINTRVLDPARIQEAALASGYRLPDDAAKKTSMLLYSHDYRRAISEACAPNQPADVEAVPAFAQPLLAIHRASVANDFAIAGYDLVTRGFDIRDWSDWVAVLKYRFVDPNTRRGSSANYVQRLCVSDAMILTQSWPVAIFRSPWHPPVPGARVQFRFVQQE